ncbi:hypothetical protein B9G54_04410 [Alloscardovia macacae]|uniref:Uncharacterized protein n=2 Tax=Alloscardovia macacae TaxID=1160091 RepID=A0A1Y2SUJ6_9BIFI|nr:hypothetical protein B9G54_04410 [Alloscardovia macacae]OTA29911.1 hypothetical protein B9T39_02035 [Alloscardovia macacae]
MNSWNAEILNKVYTHNGLDYRANVRLTSGMTLIDLAARETSGGNRSLVVLVLAADQPMLEEPPAAPVKQITSGTSADSMVNTTMITSGTGVGGKNLVFTDQISPNGQSYTVRGQRVVDVTSGQDVSNAFSFAQNGDTVSAAWSGGQLPSRHDFQFSFDVVMSTPAKSVVSDVASVAWNTRPAVSTDRKEFPTWTFTPNKAWVKYDAEAKKWQTLTDPTGSNTVGADTLTVLDGSKVGSVVNTTIPAGLAQAPQKFEISDDYSKADYVWDPDMQDVHVYVADTSNDQTASVNDIASSGRDVTGQFDIRQTGSTITASMKSADLVGLKSLASARQYTLLIGGKANYANGKGTDQVRKDLHADESKDLAFCEVNGQKLTNAASAVVNNDVKKTNEPHICGWIPKTTKSVLSEASQGGSQDDVNGKSVFPGQKLEYTLDSEGRIPQLAEKIATVRLADSYDEYLKPDMQTIELMDLSSGRMVSKKDYTLTHDAGKHVFTIELKSEYVTAHFASGAAYRLQLRFEGTVSKDAPHAHQVDNQWQLTVNNELVNSNIVSNTPTTVTPDKGVSSTAGVNIDGKTLYYGDSVYYRISLDASDLSNTAYAIQRLGIIDDYDEEYLNLDESGIEVLDATGRDVTGKLNIQVKDGVVYAFFKTVDTEYLDTILKGDPQPSDLKAYAEKQLNPAVDPQIDQRVLGQKYTLVLPMKVAKVSEGKTIENTATQVTNERTDITNTVSNPVKPINPKKDVTVRVGGDSAMGKSIYKDHQFLYRLDSSKLDASRAYTSVKNWRIVDDYNEKYDQPTGQWAVYANTDIKDAQGSVVVAKGARIDGSGLDTGYFTFTDKDGKFTLEATDKFLSLASSSSSDLTWTAYVQMTRIAVSERVENTFVETMNDVKRESNLVWTKTPDQTPAIKLVKYDQASGLQAGDRNTPLDALQDTKNGTVIVFRIVNTGAVDLTHITLTDKTIAGTGEVTDLKYPDGFDNLILKPGAYVEVTGTLTNMTGVNHTNRGKTTGVPLIPCKTTDSHPFDPKNKDGNGEKSSDGVQPVRMCEDTPVSAEDDWNGVKLPEPVQTLAKTGSTVTLLASLALAAASVGVVFVWRKQRIHE